MGIVAVDWALSVPLDNTTEQDWRAYANELFNGIAGIWGLLLSMQKLKSKEVFIKRTFVFVGVPLFIYEYKYGSLRTVGVAPWRAIVYFMLSGPLFLSPAAALAGTFMLVCSVGNLLAWLVCLKNGFLYFSKTPIFCVFRNQKNIRSKKRVHMET